MQNEILWKSVYILYIRVSLEELTLSYTVKICLILYLNGLVLHAFRSN